MKFMCHGVCTPEPNCIGDITVGWNLGFRAVIGSPERIRSGLSLHKGALYYAPVFDFRRPVNERRFPDLNEVWSIEGCPDGGFQMWLPEHETIVVGLGITLDFGSFNWIHGSISLRKQWMLSGLELVNTNTPIHGGHRSEVFVLLRNNGPDAKRITSHERPVQIHFYQGLVSPAVSICAVADQSYVI